MTESFPRILFCTWEIPQSVYAGSMQLYRVMQGYPGDRLMVLGNAPAPGAQLLPCRYEPLNLLTHRLFQRPPTPEDRNALLARPDDLAGFCARLLQSEEFRVLP